MVSAKRNLAIDTQARQSVLYIDANATAEQRAASIDLITAKRRAVVGEIVHAKVAPIAFVKESVEYKVHVGEVLDLAATRYPCQYCTQPHQIWYKPPEQVDDAVVGKSKVYRYEDAILPTTWNQGEPANNVFVGKFTM